MRDITCKARGLQALLAVLVVGRDFTVLLVTENTTRQLDLIKASPPKQRNYDASTENAREHTLFFFLNGEGQENMIQFVFREADILLRCLIWQETTVPSCKLAKH